MTRKPAFLLRLARDARGLSAVEFALLAPVMIALYFGVAEVGQAFMIQKRQAHVASMVADLVAQTDIVDMDDLDDILSAGALVVKPFSATNLTVTITSVKRDDKGVDRVLWSYGSKTRKSNDVVTKPSIPAGMITANGGGVVMAETTYKYVSPGNRFIKDGLTFTGTFFLLPRRVDVVECTDCPKTT